MIAKNLSQFIPLNSGIEAIETAKTMLEISEEARKKSWVVCRKGPNNRMARHVYLLSAEEFGELQIHGIEFKIIQTFPRTEE